MAKRRKKTPKDLIRTNGDDKPPALPVTIEVPKEVADLPPLAVFFMGLILVIVSILMASTEEGERPPPP